jgi:hydroxymethylbilane synthase
MELMKKRIKKNKVSIGTRASKLALWQAEWVKSELEKLYPDLQIELKKIKTTGDKVLDVPLAKVGGKGLFVKEIEEALLKNEVDIAVHSMKDVPTEFPDGLHLAVICKREDPRDAFISKTRNSRLSSPQRLLGDPPEAGIRLSADKSPEATKSEIRKFKDLPHGATIGTSSLRRSCQLLNIRPDLKILQLRGNLDTRIRKLDEGQFDAIILAAAGVKRLGLEKRITEILPVDTSLPAIGQGAIGIECRVDDDFINKLLEPLNHPETSVCVRAERAFLKRLEGGCQVPIAAHAIIIGQKSKVRSQKSKIKNNQSLLVMDGLVGSISGDRIIKGHIEENPEKAESLGITLAEDILSRGALEILNEVYGRSIPAGNRNISHQTQ